MQMAHDATLVSQEKPAPTSTSTRLVHGAPSFEEMMYWASITRQEEHVANQAYKATTSSPSQIISLVCKARQPAAAIPSLEARDAVVTEQEWKRASRAMRTTGWGAVFYLITTDVLGPYGAPWAFAQLGYGPGIAVFAVFGILSGYSAYIMWKVFMGLDSDRYPLLTYGDLFARIFGNRLQHFLNVMLGIQLIFVVSLIILSSGQAISQISQSSRSPTGICFIACLLIITAAGFLLGQVRTLQRFALLSNFATWINVLGIAICMGVVAHSPPNFKATQASYGKEFGPGPIRTFTGTPPDGLASGGNGMIATFNGMNSAVFSYGGSMLFITFLAEMRHPADFYKGMMLAQVFISCVYVIFGAYVYSYQGQFAFNPIMQGLSPYAWQTAANVMYIFPCLISAALYGNICLKIIYSQLLQDVFGFPPLTERSGKVAWAASMPIYWALAFVIAAAVPQFTFVSGFISALFMLAFTYTLPALLALGYWLKKDAMTAEEHFDPQTGTYAFQDVGWTRWKRAFVKHPLFHVLNFIYMVAGLVTMALGVYSSIRGLISAFSGKSVATTFGCTPPV
ncbi:hypothetical protein CDD81_2809 [Ophiocordyceps australis]|uniref:Amino acid transporter transmembrane domain-containing protein n=1 Tax=Ophiocordyceps australis TaxID=1399860 RepID=A0A2C5XY43_9HYPO|nr:hypothetical protein CDD81_2809 [Ophiocordyceps australis]